MAQITDILEASVDFNEVDEHGHLVVARSNFSSARAPRVGEGIHLRDSEGNSCWGSGVRFTETVAHIRLDAATWAHGDIESHAVVPGEPVAALTPPPRPAEVPTVTLSRA